MQAKVHARSQGKLLQKLVPSWERAQTQADCIKIRPLNNISTNEMEYQLDKVSCYKTDGYRTES